MALLICQNEALNSLRIASCFKNYFQQFKFFIKKFGIIQATTVVIKEVCRTYLSTGAVVADLLPPRTWPLATCGHVGLDINL